jgi:hypothetical protein
MALTPLAALRLPVELLTTIFEELPRLHDLAAAARVCRSWMPIAAAVLWRSPPEDTLRRLPAAARRVHGAAHVTELSLASRHVGRILLTPLPRLCSLRVSHAVVLAHTQRFCGFVRDHSRQTAVGALDTGHGGISCCSGHGIGGSGGGSGGGASSNAANPSGRVSRRRNRIVGMPIRQLTSVCITLDITKTSRFQPLPTEVLIVLAHAARLRQFVCEANVTLESVQAAISSIGQVNDVGSTSTLPPGPQQQQQQPQDLRVLSHHYSQYSVAVLYLQHMRASTVTELNFYIHAPNTSSGGDGGNRAAAMLRTIARFTELRRLTLGGVQAANTINGPAGLVSSASDAGPLRALHQLRLLDLNMVWPAATDDALLHLLQGMPDIAVLRLRPAGALSAGVVPAIGVACPALEELDLGCHLDVDCFRAVATQAPTLPNLTRLSMRNLVYVNNG